MKQIDKNEIDLMNNKIPSKIKLTAEDEANEFAENIINTVREPLLILDKDLRVVKASRSFYNFFKVSPEETIGNLIYDLGNRQWDIPQLRDLLETILPEKTSFDDYEVKHVFSKIGKRVMLLNARQIKRAFGKEKIILLAIEDITDRKKEEDSLFESSRITSEYLDILLDRSHVPIIIWSSSFKIVRFNIAFEKLCGYDIAELKDKMIEILFPEDKIKSTLEFLKHDINKAKVEVFEIDILTKNKNIKTVLWNSENILDKESEFIVATMAQDITKRKRTEEKLSVLETRYRRLFESAQDGILILDAETGTITDVNPFLVELSGYSREEFVDKEIWEIGFFKDIAASKEKFLELQYNEYVRYDNLPLETNHGRKINVEFVSNVYFVNNRKVIQCNVRDNTERKLAEDKLKTSEESFKIIFDYAPDAYYLIDLSGNFIAGNIAAGKLLDYNKHELIGENFFKLDILSPVQQIKAAKLLAKNLEGQSTGPDEFDLKRSDGSNVTVEISTYPVKIKNRVVVLGIARDISERKRAEKEITMLAHSLKSINECVSLTDMEDKIIFVNESFLKTYGYDKNELIGKHISKLRSSSNPDTLAKDISFSTLNGGWSGELLNKRKDGSEFPVYLSTTIVYDKDKKPAGLIGVASDITERNKMIDELRKLSMAVDQSPTSIMITDTDGNIEYANPKVSEITGYYFADLVGKNSRMFSSGEKPKEEYKHLWNTITSGKEWRGEFHNKKKNGELYWESASISAIKNDKGETTNYLALKEDITEKKLIEEELIEAKKRAENSDKLKSEFLAQMSHEIRTPLGAIVGNVDYLLESQVEKMDADTRDCFDGIELASKRIIRTVDLILNASELQRSSYKPNFVKVNLDSDILEKLIIEHSRSAKQRGLELIYVNELDDTVILADEYSITQIFANLIDNAIKYTNIGKVEIFLIKNNSGNIVVEVRDTGIGMSKEFLPRLFEPFAQEEQGYSRSFDGNGLGLALVKKYCDINNAVIEVQTEKKMGTIFSVIFDKKVQEELN
ncbi:MAG: PAS domain S-box protein [Ignavibacteriaceae bacterium]